LGRGENDCRAGAEEKKKKTLPNTDERKAKRKLKTREERNVILFLIEGRRFREGKKKKETLLQNAVNPKRGYSKISEKKKRNRKEGRE